MRRWAPVLPALLLAACGASRAQPATCDADAPRASIAGVYVDNFGGAQVISDDFWMSGGSVFEICGVDEGKHQIIAANSPRNAYNPGKFSRFDWLQKDNRLWYCQTVYQASSLEEARSQPAPDTRDPAKSGCGQFAWSNLVRILQ